MEFKGYKIFEEEPAAGNSYRQGYADGLSRFISHSNAAAKDRRREFMPPKELVQNNAKWREKFIEMLGIESIPDGNTPPPLITPVGEDELSKIYRLTVYITPEIPFYGMLLMPHGAKDVPLVVCQHGGSGTPELLCGFNGNNSYGFAAQKLLKMGAAVLAPQLLLWSLKETETARDYKVQYNRNEVDTNLRRFGITLTGLEIKSIMKLIDFCCERAEICPHKIGMAGLSYGGYYTLYTMAVDKRIKVGLAAGIFNDRDCYPWSDTTYWMSGNTFQDAEVAALCAPRPLYVAVGKADNVFDYKTALPELSRVPEYFAAYGKPENFKFRVWEGGHRFPETEDGFNFLMKGLQNNE